MISEASIPTHGIATTILIQIGAALAIGIGILTLSYFLGQKGTPNKTKNSPYECGMPGGGNLPRRFPIRFYLTAMLFILFDIEIVFLIPWALVYRDFLQASFPIVAPVLFFIGVLGLGLAYEWRKGALKWESRSRISKQS